jgi:hypothetical protein
LRGRHIAEVTHALGRAGRALVAARERRYRELRLTLETYDLRRQIGAVGTRLARVDGALRAAAVRSHTRADARFREQAARLESLSPLAVLGRGYAVCWDDTRTRIVRDAGAVREGDAVRVTLHRGELECTVSSDYGDQYRWAGQFVSRSRDAIARLTARKLTTESIGAYGHHHQGPEAAVAELKDRQRSSRRATWRSKSLEFYERGVQLSRFCHRGWRRPTADRSPRRRGELKPAPATLSDIKPEERRAGATGSGRGDDCRGR